MPTTRRFPPNTQNTSQRRAQQARIGQALAQTAPSRTTRQFSPGTWTREVTRYARNALAPSTQSNYQSAWKSFISFCDSNNVHRSLRFPADELVLCAFAVSHAGAKAGSSVANLLAGLKTWHSIHNKPWNGGPRLTYVLKGVAKSAPASSSRPPRPPITADMIRRLHDALDLDRPHDAAIFAIAAVAFWGQCRIGELLSTSRLDVRNVSLPSISSLERQSSANGTRELHLPRTKTNQTNGQRIVLTRQDRRSDPLRALALLLQSNGRLPRDTYLFAYKSGPLGELRALTKETFMEKVNAIWGPMGYNRVTGHCFRIGGTTELLQSGVPVDLVKSMGRWRSDAFQRYWRGVGELAARHAELLHTRANISRPRPSLPRRPARVRRQAVPA